MTTMLPNPMLSRARPQPSPPAPVDVETKALRAMFAARKRVFVDLLGWDLPVLAGRFEVDQFDNPCAEYLVLADTDGNHCGSARLLRSDGPHLLGDLYAHLCPAGVPCGPGIREITRFCLDPALGAVARRKTRNQLVTALAEHALAHGIAAYTGIATHAWFEQIARFGWVCRKLGPAGDLRASDLVALQITIDDQTLPGLIAGGVYDRAARVLHRAGDLA
ncbi:acyl homoserine lactone synthase/acyl-homoserine lactone synthase [Novosphingobium sp. BK486]|nr:MULTISPECIES: acyl-homoserine-lactone synthase [unclassified Novosphingobium]MBB3356273.1 acyl homoserine lactone synthase/acyl-homoserine lactone synthase [Novosphingobium sp. BK256]MBB3372674.1 acyl homoserine lactone synthase/acyl-homoserine lactone synthase [Novosphingobium sp. BK280]MBB3377041.1 acyl homoserine lactone synthase/acyl-homoserine lactone synthase [Novosphingobium sp. BK258]MBB3419547.1 acyl homoserine lactone synthase/acyl-homoserine lactone synthase [Novosphingobium sp. B